MPLPQYTNINPPLVIVDFGTATTFCAVDRNGNYVGGVIAAGIKISMDALFEKTAKLPKVEIIKPSSVIGRNTIDAIQSGAVYGQAGQADGIIRRIKKRNRRGRHRCCNRRTRHNDI